MIDIINSAVAKDAKLYCSVSGGKDGQAMTKLLSYLFIIEGMIHADLGSVEWPQSMGMCERQAEELNVPLHVIKRSDGRGMLEHWKARLKKLKNSGKPFWSSSKNRYCTSDLKRDPINKFLRNCGNNFVISCEGIRAEESVGRAKKPPLAIRESLTSTYYKGMSVEEAIAKYNPKKRLALTWYPIFTFNSADVWGAYNMTAEKLEQYREVYKANKVVVKDWPFHPAYVMGNERVSCMFCILGSANDLKVAAVQNPELLKEMIQMEEDGDATFKNKWSLKNLLNINGE